ncbi:protein kinase [Pseudonocardia sp. RS11V-5]|uniref:protein kinase domain-containing protein n=1 Tax=Pseudonocardia terrae TaxID=2905831 RepID=UPI001E4B9F72|nr:protein kinase [Pseudonocardia terrae]MCE3554300.1 protein kinase [Pseudonocardia terrae]
MIPSRLIGGRYLVLDGLGAGLLGPVWRAEDRLTGRYLAVQELHVPDMSPAEHAQFRERLLREARRIGALADPGLLAVHDVLSDCGIDHVVTELAVGTRLTDHVASGGPLATQDAVATARVLLRTLGAAHHRQLVHGAVRPAAVVLGDDGRIALADVGLALPAEEAGVPVRDRLGPHDVVAPERTAGHPASAAADMWGLGATLAFAGATEEPLSSLVAALRTEDPAARPTADEALAMLGRNGSSSGTSGRPWWRIWDRPRP